MTDCQSIYICCSLPFIRTCCAASCHARTQSLSHSVCRPRTASKDDRLPTARSASGSPVSVRMSSRKVSKKSSNKGKGAPSSSRREAARRVAHKIKMYESEAQRRRSASPPGQCAARSPRNVALCDWTSQHSNVHFATCVARRSQDRPTLLP